MQNNYLRSEDAFLYSRDFIMHVMLLYVTDVGSCNTYNVKYKKKITLGRITHFIIGNEGPGLSFVTLSVVIIFFNGCSVPLI